MTRHPRVYRALVAFGFSPARALEITIDARRPSTRRYAMVFIRLACRRNPFVMG